MGKFVIAIALIISLLMCPLRCLARDCGTAPGGHVAPQKCCCCQPDNDCDDSPSKDDEQENDCSCPDCICEGATLQDGSEVSTFEVQVAVAHWPIPSDVANQCAVKLRTACVRDRLPHCVGGRAALIAFQVWLI